MYASSSIASSQRMTTESGAIAEKRIPVERYTVKHLKTFRKSFSKKASFTSHPKLIIF